MTVIANHGVDVRTLTWTPWGARPVLDGVTFGAARGERILVAGASGSGKSTLLRAIAGVLDGYEPGDLSGSITLSGRPIVEQPGSVGLLLQNPKNQVVAGSVARDAAFGAENAGLLGSPLRSLVRTTLDVVRLHTVGLDVRSTHLSGGQGQRLGLAGLLGLNPELLLLDEPLSMLDDDSSSAVVRAIVDAVESVDATMIVADHDLSTWWPHVDRVIVLERGRLVFDGSPAAALEQLQGHPELWLPGRAAAPPTPVDWEAVPAFVDDTALLRADEVSLSDGQHMRLAPTSLDLHPGRAIGVVGESGAGKSTLLRLLAGWEAPSSGRVIASPTLAGSAGTSPHRWKSRHAAHRIAFIVQDPSQAIIASTVEEELLVTRRMTDRIRVGDEHRVSALLESLGLSGLGSRNPHTLSGGEQRRLSVAVALASDAPVVLFDEPTVGQDRRSWQAVAGAIQHLAETGRATLIATHDAHLRVHTVDTHRLTPAVAAEGTLS